MRGSPRAPAPRPMFSHPLSPLTTVPPPERRIAALEAMLAERTDALRKSEERYRTQAAIVAAADDAEQLDREVAGLVREAARGGPFEAVEYQAVAKGGALLDGPLAVHAIRDDAGEIVGVSSIGRNIGARTRHVAELERVNRRLAESNAEPEAFSYSASHDLRAPLRAIDGLSRLLFDEFGSDLAPEARRHLGLVREGAMRMGDLIDGLLRLSHLGRQGLERVSVDAHAVAREALVDVGADVTATVEIAPLGVVDADPRLLRQVFANLLGNALEFSASRADVSVEVGVSPTDGDLLLHDPGAPAVKPSDILLVEDNPHDVESALPAIRRDNLSKAIHVARDGEEALDFLFGGPMPQLSLILLALKLPKIDGHVDGYIVEPVDVDTCTEAIRVLGGCRLLPNEPPWAELPR